MPRPDSALHDDGKTSRSPPPPPCSCGCGAVIFVHISKCGGRTVEEMLRRLAAALGWGWLRLSIDLGSRHGPHAVFWPQWAAFREINQSIYRKVSPCSGPFYFATVHDGFSLGAMWPVLRREWAPRLRARGCSLHLVTILRQPEERALSDSLWTIGHKLEYDPSARRSRTRVIGALPRDANTGARVNALEPSGLQEILRVANTHPNMMARYLVHGDWRQWPVGAREYNATHENTIRLRAAQMLSAFSIVGRLDDLPGFARRVSKLHEWCRWERFERNDPRGYGGWERFGHATKLLEGLGRTLMVRGDAPNNGTGIGNLTAGEVLARLSHAQRQELAEHNAEDLRLYNDF